MRRRNPQQEFARVSMSLPVVLVEGGAEDGRGLGMACRHLRPLFVAFPDAASHPNPFLYIPEFFFTYTL